MQNQTKHIPSDNDRQIERAIVAQTLRDDHDCDWTRAELDAQLGHIGPGVIGEALARLADEGVVELADETVRASPATVRLEELGMIAV